MPRKTFNPPPLTMNNAFHSEIDSFGGLDAAGADGRRGAHPAGWTSDGPGAAFGGRLIFYHPNSKGNGSAMQLELRLNRRPGDRYNCFFLEMARQRAPGRSGRDGEYARFDWAAKVTTKLSFLDVCAFLTVLEGRQNHLGQGGKGLYHQTASSNTLIHLSRENGQEEGLLLRISRKDDGRSEPIRINMLLNEYEVTGLRHVFASGLIHLALHREGRIPQAADPVP